MSGICGQFHLDNQPGNEADLGPAPVRHADSGCVLVADATLYYRDELHAALGLENTGQSDAELILAAYLRWGDGCAEHLQGDFAFAILDTPKQRLFCARDRYGMRPFYYHHAQHKQFVFASDARDVARNLLVPFAVNEGRIADFIVPELEWIDYTSTFYEKVLRLPPAHSLTVSSSGLELAEYWTPVPGPELVLKSDAEYCSAFLDVFSRAVKERLRTPDNKVAASLSGGMDSGSVVAIARDRVHPFSLARARGVGCQESQRIYAALDHLGLKGTQIIADDEDSLPDVLGGDLAEPFDGEFLFLEAIYLAAKRDGAAVVLDGAAGDIVLNESGYIPRLLRHGRFVRAWQEIAGEQAFWNGSSTALAFGRYLGSAFAPEPLKRATRTPRQRRRERGYIDQSLISPDFASRIDIEARFDRMRGTFSKLQSRDPAVERVRKIRPNLTAGRERYARIAAAAGVEARDPFTDQHVVDFCSCLPDEQLARHGWPKFLLREAMAGKLPDEVRWGRGKPHIGHLCNEAFVRREYSRGNLRLAPLVAALEGYIDPVKLRAAWQDFEAGRSSQRVHSATILARWLGQSVNRPVVKNQGFS